MLAIKYYDRSSIDKLLSLYTYNLELVYRKEVWTVVCRSRKQKIVTIGQQRAVLKLERRPRSSCDVRGNG